MLRAALLAVTLLSLGAGRAHADTLSTFNFSGTCMGCSSAAGTAGTAAAQLVLTNYTLGQQIDDTNFVSFTYAGAGGGGGYTITEAQGPSFLGSIDGPLPDTELVNVSLSSGPSFESNKDGSWSSITLAGLSDSGSVHLWSAPAVIAMPEPVTASLLGGGLLGVAALRRRR